MELTAPLIMVDGVAIPAKPGQNILEVCLAAGLELPYFCWHPALGSVGACRQCAVKIFAGSDDATGQIVMACMTKAISNTRISITDEAARLFREQVVEFVLTNHPHDCPVCEVGGECHLQDMAAVTGHTTRRYRFTKRTHLNQYLGPFIKHEMNRCIGCYRCVRFYRDHAGGDDFGVFGANRNVYFGRAEDGALESEFAGNLVEVCPTGVFVDKPFSARFARKWDMRATPSVCPLCAVGCNITVQERGGSFRRVTSRYNQTLNGYFLCDRGRFGAAFLESPKRLRNSRRGADVLDVAQEKAALADFMRPETLIGIGSPRASLEANFALRALVGVENFYAGVSAADYESLMAAVTVMQRHGPHLATIGEVARADAVLILGDDPSAIAPVLALALRQVARRASTALLAARDIPAWHADAAARAAVTQETPFIIATPVLTRLDNLASALHRRTPDLLTRWAFAIAAEIDPAAPKPGAADDAAIDIAAALSAAKSPLIVVGGAVCGPALLAAAGNITGALRRIGVHAKLVVMVPESNSLGLGLMAAKSLEQAFDAMAGSHVLVVENDLYRRIDNHVLEGHLHGAASLCVLDHIETATVQAADIAVAVGSFGDGDGTTINLEFRAQRSFKAIFGERDPPQTWRILRDAGIMAGRLALGSWPDQAALLAGMEAQIPALQGCAAASPPTTMQPPASLPYRYSGRTAETADRDVREPAPPLNIGGFFGTTMEGPRQLRAPGWNSGQAINRGGVRNIQNEGVLLFRRSPGNIAYFPLPPPARPVDGLIFIPVSRVFGGEELSVHADAIAARMEPPVVTLAPSDARLFGLESRAWVICEVGRMSVRRMVVLDAAMPAGVAAVMSGLPGEVAISAATQGSIRMALA